MSLIESIRALLFVSLAFLTLPSYGFELGVHTHAQRYNQDASEVNDNITKFGFNSIRSDMTWNWVEKEKNVFSLSNAAIKNQELIDLVAKEGNNSLVVLAYGNINHTPTGYPENSSEIDDFIKYVRFVVARNKGKVKYYEVWNEWVYKTGIKDRHVITPSTDVYLELVGKTYKVIKEIDPHAIVISGTVNPTNKRDVKWFDELINKGVLNYLDGISLHPYSFMHGNQQLRKPTANYSDLVNYQKHIESMNSGRSVPFYITEMGVPTYDGKGGVSRLDAAIFMFKYTLLAMSNQNIKGIWWYDYSDDGVDRRNKENNFGLFDYYYKPKSAAVAIKAVKELTKNSIVKLGDVNGDITITIRNVSNENIRQVTWHDGNYSPWAKKEQGLPGIYNERLNSSVSRKEYLNIPQVY